jgi:ankyrin repeat protein
MVEALVRRGADPATRLRRIIRELPFQATPLHVAVQHDCASAAKALLGAGAPPSAGAEDGKPTPLHIAAAEGLEELVQLLLDGGADREAREVVYDATPADWADFAGYRELAVRLRARS